MSEGVPPVVIRVVLIVGGEGPREPPKTGEGGRPTQFWRGEMSPLLEAPKFPPHFPRGELSEQCASPPPPAHMDRAIHRAGLSTSMQMVDDAGRTKSTKAAGHTCPGGLGQGRARGTASQEKMKMG
eukprot:CAMPEP_0174365326 /NCGR_PEP_ID=MMETSP0811_2-20130205/76818_1 /TAXON_ID=73025 ORGANISM="Eutreptiella gymnastica-like, Strain CCMP1594" /NCGR_SAMPLE_ID=MMETSP0811_2 /ASSEMBLY_ACC=CAM_ASM_000667 /LENGTH=125 /DNA_ID=CAMNT_0015505881 /DNA_START=350 /DNA_END=723 /DNA_ORIENTATION=-